MTYTIVWSHRHVVCVSFSTVLLSLLSAGAQTEMKRVVGDNATLPCHHQFWQSNGQTLDIEWLLQKPNIKQRVVRDLLFFMTSQNLSCLLSLFILFLFYLDFSWCEFCTVHIPYIHTGTVGIYRKLWICIVLIEQIKFYFEICLLCLIGSQLFWIVYIH